ncbi:MAG: 7-cyano-7-deazaguanine synthase [Crenarchaeota archaeon]|nr:MAG: 7-cyano-7-deazaguanine synthase [Thermoproteota archaeon]RDJ34404.1 MAG: 7-cyano-7-deazaguanine synthase [Thermoproteota archaeon]RDJ34741.1 MAG: 7-cyano-7-deazaguanine synthase [Thermoproteota archaeon]RDJ38658.1 MAG: 7-cyano-7-deazaguanine synthase [Thermoproteota archaeon]
MKKAVVIFSGGIDSVCTAVHLKPNFQLYGITFSYGQRADQEIKIAKKFSKSLGFKEHKIVNIGFMRDLYGKTNVLTDSKRKIPQKFEYSIVVPIRNAVFLSIASAWAYTLGASLVAYGAHKGDTNYPDCRPSFAKKIESAFNEGEIDGIKKKIRKPLEVWSPYRAGLSKSDLIKIGQKNLGLDIFKTWSCYESKKFHCGKCESCNNRKVAFATAGVTDQTVYL